MAEGDLMMMMMMMMMIMMMMMMMIFYLSMMMRMRMMRVIYRGFDLSNRVGSKGSTWEWEKSC